MPRAILDQREICSTLKRQGDEAGPHPMRRHRDPDGLRVLLDDTFDLVGMERPFLGMIAFAKADKERRFRYCTRPASRLQIVINRLPDLDREFGEASFIAFAVTNDRDMVALFHHQIAKGQRHRFRATNAGAQKEHEESIISFAKGSAAINRIQERFGFLAFQGAMGTFILSSFEAANAFCGVLWQKTPLDRFIKQPLGNGPHPCSRRLCIGFRQVRPIGNQIIPVQ